MLRRWIQVLTVAVVIAVASFAAGRDLAYAASAGVTASGASHQEHDCGAPPDDNCSVRCILCHGLLDGRIAERTSGFAVVSPIRPQPLRIRGVAPTPEPPVPRPSRRL